MVALIGAGQLAIIARLQLSCSLNKTHSLSLDGVETSAGLSGTKLVNVAKAQLAAELISHEIPVGGDKQRDFKNSNKL